MIVKLILVTSIGYCMYLSHVDEKKTRHKRNMDQIELGRRNVVQIWDKEF